MPAGRPERLGRARSAGIVSAGALAAMTSEIDRTVATDMPAAPSTGPPRPEGPDSLWGELARAVLAAAGMHIASGTSARAEPPPVETHRQRSARLQATPRFLQQFLDAAPAEALALWLRWKAPAGLPRNREQLLRMLARDIADIDALLSDQVDAILHHPQFQRLEASWRGLRYLVDQIDPEEHNIRIRVLSVSWAELARDLERAGEFDQSQLFRKVYSAEFDMPGGTPYGLLLGDYEIRHTVSPEGVNDLRVLQGIAEVAAAAWAPFVAAAHPALLGLDSFADLQFPLNLPQTFEQLEYLKWRAFRDSEDSRFVGLVLPRVLRRLPYEDDGSRRDGFRYRENVAGPDARKYLWGTAVYAFGAVVARSFADSGWLASIRGVQRGVEGGGLVTGLPVHWFSTHRPGLVPKPPTDVIIHDRQEPELSELGFIPLCACPDTPYAAFYAAHSVQKPRKYSEPAATLNAKVSAMLPYLLCASRFAHYIKVILRDKVGTFAEPEECEDFLHRWIHQYVTADPEASPEVKARLPLREARIQVRAHPAKPGSFRCIAHLWPHYELDELTTTLRVATEVRR